MRVSFECLECGKIFKSASSDPRCPGCRGVDLEVAYEPAPIAFREEECGGAFDGFNVYSDADPGL